ncbi:hypothetical protein INR49_010900 [Caranx melampygus]|nr:hypothetical protein INR49_010900 [Caranx melampygus]
METKRQLEFSLLSWGANSYGQLGQGHVEDQAAPRLSDTAALQSRVVRTVSGGGGHSVFVTENGQVFVCGQNNRGQLGLGHTTDILTLQLCCSLKQAVTNVACGWDFTLLVTDCGQVLACGSNAFGQLGVGPTVTHSADLLLVEYLKDPVESVAAGLRHSLAVTNTGRVYQWGTGLLSLAKRALSPHPIPSHLCSKVPCVVPEDGDLFLWGSNKHGQLTTTEPFLSSPTPLNRRLLDGEKVIHLGRKTSIKQNPELQSAGPLAEGGHQEVCPPAEVKALHGATQIACGSEHNLAIVGGCLLSWGWNEHGMCGDGSQTDVFQPQLISGLRPLLIGCGAGHSMAVCAVATGS